MPYLVLRRAMAVPAATEGASSSGGGHCSTAGSILLYGPTYSLVLSECMLLPLCTCYAVSGTDLVYAATRIRLCGRNKNSR
eukprot:3941821-Rhodomonas_salina.5